MDTNRDSGADEVPLIWTTKGNLPISSLEHSVEWRVADGFLSFIERHTLGGEVVKQAVHLLDLTGVIGSIRNAGVKLDG